MLSSENYIFGSNKRRLDLLGGQFLWLIFIVFLLRFPLISPLAQPVVFCIVWYRDSFYVSSFSTGYDDIAVVIQAYMLIYDRDNLRPPVQLI